MSSTHADPQFPAMGQPEAQALLYAKMSKVLAAVQRVPKNGVNQHFGYRFVREADLTEAIRQHMAEHNLCLFVGATDLVDTRPTDGKAGPVTTVKMTATFACGDGLGMAGRLTVGFTSPPLDVILAGGVLHAPRTANAPRALWSSRAPLPMVATIIVLLLCVWLTYAFVVIQLLAMRNLKEQE